MTSDRDAVRKVLGPFYKTIDVMKSARNSEAKTMSVWADDMKAVEDVMLFLERLRDTKSEALDDLLSRMTEDNIHPEF